MSLQIITPHTDLDTLNRHSVHFDGTNDYMDIGTAADIEFERTDAFSFSFWLDPNSSKTEKFYGGRENGGDWKGLEMLLVDERYQFILSGSSSGPNRIYLETRDQFLIHYWRHVVYTYDGSSSLFGVHIYVDGVDQLIRPFNNSLTLSTVYTGPNKKIGTNYANNQNYAGNIDRVGIFNEELSAQDVLEIYNNRHLLYLNNLSCNNCLIHYWLMGDTGDNLIIPDEVGSLDGTLTNMDGSSIENEVP